MLKIRPYPHVGESQAGYVLRLATENDLKNGLRDLQKMLGLQSDRRIVNWEDAKMDSILGKRFSYENIPLRHYGAGKKLHFTYRNKVIDGYHFNRHAQKYCPQCIRENPYFRGDWDLSFVTACETHQCVLVDHCEKCNSSFSWSRRNHLHCDCGHPMIENNNNTPTIPEVIALQRMILAGLLGRPADPEIFVAFPEFLALKDIKNGEIGMRIIENFYRIVCNKVKPSVNLSIHLHVRLMHEAVQLFSSLIRTSSFIRDIAIVGQPLKFYPTGSRHQFREIRLPPSTSHATSLNAFQ